MCVHGFVCIDGDSRDPLCMGLLCNVENWAIQKRHFPKLFFSVLVLGRRIYKAQELAIWFSACWGYPFSLGQAFSRVCIMHLQSLPLFSKSLFLEMLK